MEDYYPDNPPQSPKQHSIRSSVIFELGQSQINNTSGSPISQHSVSTVTVVNQTGNIREEYLMKRGEIYKTWKV